MQGPLNEARRIELLKHYSVLESKPEPLFNHIAWLAAHHFGTAIGTVGFIDESREWFTAAVGTDIKHLSRAEVFCNHTINQDDVMVVPDAMADPRFRHFPLVTGEPKLRFYAGAPLRTADGVNLGTVAVLDPRPRADLDGDDRRFLSILARMVMEELEMRVAREAVKSEGDQRMRVESELRQALTDAEKANRARSRFLAAANHDMRQPMQSLLLSLGLLRQKLKAHPALASVQSALAAANALRGIMDDLLDVARIDAGLVIGRPMPTAVAPLLTRLMQKFQPRARAKNLVMRARPCPATVLTDPALLERVLGNLIENALRYTDTGGILLACRMRGGRMRIEVVDTGIGVPPEHAESIFDEFVQLGNPERDRAKGLGLGLTVARRLGRLLGHEVGVVSRPGKGSRFYVELDVTVPAADTAATVAEGEDASGRVLVIDDERMVLEALQVTLNTWGFDVVTAESIDQALPRLHGQAPDAILADYRLRANTTGVQAIRTVEQSFGRPIPGLIITGDTSPDRLAEVKASGYALLHKPVNPDELRRSVQRLLESHAVQ
ncbi:MAG: ATP-binding protein [Solirubrobacterales bacterium]